MKMVKRRGGAARKEMIVNRGAWTADEDQKLVNYVRAHGDKNWRTLPAKAGLNRCGKSCRLRWLNYLRPGIKRGNISEDEEDLIIRLHNLIGNRWSLIAGRLPGRTDNEIKNHWNTHLSKKALTIQDLNSRFHQHPENTSSNASHTPFSSEDSPAHRALPPDDRDCNPRASQSESERCLPQEMSQQVIDTDGLLDLPWLPELGDITWQYPCHQGGLSMVYLQPPLGREDFGLDDFMGLVDWRDYHLYLP